MIFRKGDLVFYYDGKKEKRAIVQGNEDDWYCIKDYVDIKAGNCGGTILNIKDIFSMVKREDLEEWWRFI